MKSEKKKGLAILLGLPKPDEDTEDTSSSYEEEGLEAAAEEILDAIKAEDAKGLVEAMKSFVTLCSKEEE